MSESRARRTNNHLSYNTVQYVRGKISLIFFIVIHKNKRVCVRSSSSKWFLVVLFKWRERNKRRRRTISAPSAPDRLDRWSRTGQFTIYQKIQVTMRKQHVKKSMRPKPKLMPHVLAPMQSICTWRSLARSYRNDTHIRTSASPLFTI